MDCDMSTRIMEHDRIVLSAVSGCKCMAVAALPVRLSRSSYKPRRLASTRSMGICPWTGIWRVLYDPSEQRRGCVRGSAGIDRTIDNTVSLGQPRHLRPRISGRYSNVLHAVCRIFRSAWRILRVHVRYCTVQPALCGWLERHCGHPQLFNTCLGICGAGRHVAGGRYSSDST